MSAATAAPGLEEARMVARVVTACGAYRDPLAAGGPATATAFFVRRFTA